jgi:hypothetical protein
MMQKLDAREFSRCLVTAKVEVRLDSGVLVEGRSRDVSLNGLWFASERSLPVGNTVKVMLVLNAGGTEHRIEVHGHVVRVDEGGVAVEFTEIDSDSVDHLRRLVMYNAESAEQVETEFNSHLGIRRR